MSHVSTLRQQLDTPTTTTHINSHVYNSVNCKILITNYKLILTFLLCSPSTAPLTLSNRPHCISLWWPLHCEEESKIYFDPWKMNLAPNFIHQEKVTGIFLWWKPKTHDLEHLPLLETKSGPYIWVHGYVGPWVWNLLSSSHSCCYIYNYCTTIQESEYFCMFATDKHVFPTFNLFTWPHFSRVLSSKTKTLENWNPIKLIQGLGLLAYRLHFEKKKKKVKGPFPKMVHMPICPHVQLFGRFASDWICCFQIDSPFQMVCVKRKSSL